MTAKAQNGVRNPKISFVRVNCLAVLSRIPQNIGLGMNIQDSLRCNKSSPPQGVMRSVSETPRFILEGHKEDCQMETEA